MVAIMIHLYIHLLVAVHHLTPVGRHLRRVEHAQGVAEVANAKRARGQAKSMTMARQASSPKRNMCKAVVSAMALVDVAFAAEGGQSERKRLVKDKSWL